MFKKLDNPITLRGYMKLCGWSAVIGIIGYGIYGVWLLWRFKGEDIKNFFAEKKAKLFKKKA